MRSRTPAQVDIIITIINSNNTTNKKLIRDRGQQKFCPKAITYLFSAANDVVTHVENVNNSKNALSRSGEF